MDKIKALVTGGAGFIGSHLAEELTKRGYAVSVIDDLSTGKRENLAKIERKIRFIEGSFTDLKLLEKAADGAQLIFHLGAIPSVPKSIEDPIATTLANVEGTVAVLKCAHQKKIKRVLVASSSSVYGDAPGMPRVETIHPEPLSPYAASKIGTELMCRTYNVLGVQTVNVRMFNVYGPRQDPNSKYSAVIPKFITQALAGMPMTIFGDGNQTRDFTYVKDVVKCFIKLSRTKNSTGKTVNIARGRPISVAKLAEMIKRIAHSESKIEFLPAREGDIYESTGDSTLLKKVIKYVPDTNLETGLAATIEFFRKV